jgi:hypothetical protein
MGQAMPGPTTADTAGALGCLEHYLVGLIQLPQKLMSAQAASAVHVLRKLLLAHRLCRPTVTVNDWPGALHHKCLAGSCLGRTACRWLA